MENVNIEPLESRLGRYSVLQKRTGLVAAVAGAVAVGSLVFSAASGPYEVGDPNLQAMAWIFLFGLGVCAFAGLTGAGFQVMRDRLEGFHSRILGDDLQVSQEPA